MSNILETPKNNEIKSINEIKHPYRGKDTVFEDYLPFVKVTDEKLKEKFTAILEEMFAVSGNFWRPKLCYSTSELEKAVRMLKTKGKLSEIEFIPKSHNGAHYFLTMKFNDNNEDLIVDPYGIPTQGTRYFQNNSIIPFFGELKLAPQYHQEVYSTAEPLGKRSYRRFHLA